MNSNLSAVERSNRAEVRNPVKALPSFLRITAVPGSARALLADLLADLAKDAGERAQKCWRTHKAPMAVYWKAVSVYARHLSRAVRPIEANDNDWMPIATFSGHEAVLVCRPRGDLPYHRAAAAFVDAGGTWRVLWSEGGESPLPYIPTHWRPLPESVAA